MIITLIFLITLLLIIWFDTDAFVEYCRLFHLSKLFKIDLFDEAYKKNFELTYHHFIKRYHDCFFVRLIMCPVCLSVWLSIIFCIIFSCFINIPIVCISSLVVYYLLKTLKDEH
jgi:hypothetical protein